jgi:alkylation response protein AidB-like acyl-CoA dehydrogenase
MDFSYTPDQESLRSLAREIFTDKVTAQRLEKVESSGDRIDHDLWKDLAAAGLLGVCIPEARGGSGLGITELTIVLEEAGRSVAPVPLYSTLVVGALAIAEFGSEAQRESLLPGVVSGDIILSGALAEPHNPDPMALGTTATETDGGWVLNGTKLCVPAADAATVVIVPTRVGQDIALFLVDPHAEGVTLEPVEMTNREVQYTMTLSDVRVPTSASLGEDEDGRKMLHWITQRATVALCAMQSGVVDRAVRMTAEYASTREQFERPLAAFQAVSQRAANAYIDAEAVKLTTMAATWRLSEGLEADEAIAIAKFFAAEAAQRAVHTAQHIHGGVGVDLSYPVHRYFIWAKQLELTLGGGTTQLLRLGAALAGDAA